MKIRFASRLMTCLTVLFLIAGWAVSLPAQPPVQAPTESASPPTATQPDATLKPGTASPTGREARLAGYLSGATFTGMFTIEGESTSPKPESYTIVSCEPLAAENQYRLKVKIRYGDVDGEFPMDLKILFAGSTPVITLDGVWIPGLGTFSSRVLIHDGRYAGTWQHDAKGGHVFGTIRPAAAE